MWDARVEARARLSAEDVVEETDKITTIQDIRLLVVSLIKCTSATTR